MRSAESITKTLSFLSRDATGTYHAYHQGHTWDPESDIWDPGEIDFAESPYPDPEQAADLADSHPPTETDRTEIMVPEGHTLASTMFDAFDLTEQHCQTCGRLIGIYDPRARREFIGRDGIIRDGGSIGNLIGDCEDCRERDRARENAWQEAHAG